MGQDGAAIVILDQYRAEQAELGAGLALMLIGMAHQVKAGFGILAQGAVVEPLAKEGGGLAVAGLGVHRVGLFAAFEMHGVIGAALLQGGFQLRANHIVGRAKDGGQAAGKGRRMVTAAAEGTKYGHSSTTPARENSSGNYRAGRLESPDFGGL